jgi:glutaredoxin
MILDSKNIEYVVVDITEPGKENEKEFMQQNSNAKEAKHPLPPQIFNDDDYCGVSLILKLKLDINVLLRVFLLHGCTVFRSFSYLSFM